MGRPTGKRMEKKREKRGSEALERQSSEIQEEDGLGLTRSSAWPIFQASKKEEYFHSLVLEMGICKDTAASSRMISMYYKLYFLNNYNNRKGKKNPYEVANLKWSNNVTTKTLSALWPGETYGQEITNPKTMSQIVSLTKRAQRRRTMQPPWSRILPLIRAHRSTDSMCWVCMPIQTESLKGGKKEHWWARLSADGWILRFLRILE